MSRLVFISHRHADKAIASVLNEHLQKWQVSKDQIFQSSDSKGGANIGGNVNKELTDALSEARLVLLVYTTADADWSYCMWECGVAMDPARGTTSTRVIVFRTTEEEPPVLRDLVSVPIYDKTEVKRFVTDFFQKSGWIKEKEAFFPKITDKILDDYTDALFEDLERVAPKEKEEERRRWDVFTLALDAQTVQKVLETDKSANGKTSWDLIQKQSVVVYDFGEALKHFGYVPQKRGLSLGDLIERWSEEMAEEKEDATPREWIDELCTEMLRAIKDRPSKPIWALMRSRHYRGWWFYPIVNHVRVKGDGSMEFDVYMYRLPGSLPTQAEPSSE